MTPTRTHRHMQACVCCVCARLCEEQKQENIKKTGARKTRNVVTNHPVKIERITLVFYQRI